MQAMALRHLPDILHRLKERPFQPHAYNTYKDGNWTHLSTDQIIDQVGSLALALRELGIKKGDTVGIYAKSSHYWAIADFAIVLAGGVTVPFFSNLSLDHFLYEVEHSAPRFIFIGDEAEWKFVAPHRARFKGLINMEMERGKADCMNFSDLVKWGDAMRLKDPDAVARMEGQVDPEDLATIIYSSGSTGKPKGVELTHRNLVSIIHYEDFLLEPTDKYLNILPLAHIFAKQIHLIMTAWGVPVYYLNDFYKISEVCRSIPITRMITVPRVLEKAYSKICDNIKGAGILKRALGTLAINLAHRQEGISKKLLHPIVDRLVYSKIREGFGKNFHSIISGGAPLNPYLHQFYLNIGIPIYQGWGLTEGSTIAVNRFSKNKIGTVGPPVQGITFKISSEGEVLAKGPTIMRGYHKNPEATKLAIDPDGWLHTGDYGCLDADGHLVIQGRISESFKTSQGEFVSPVPIEQELEKSPFIDTAMVFGEGLPHPSVFLFPDIGAFERVKKKNGLKRLKIEAYLNSPDVHKEIETILERINENLDKWQKVKAYRFILIPPSIEGGELTPTFKLRRNKVLDKYSALVEDIYKDIPNVIQNLGFSQSQNPKL